MKRPFQIIIISLLALLTGFSFCSKKKTMEEMFTEAEKFGTAGNTVEAVKMYEQLITSFPDSSNQNYKKSLFMTGFLYANDEKVKDLEKAKKIYTDFIVKWPDDDLVKTVKWELDHLGKDINEIENLFKPDSTEKKSSTDK